MDRDQPEFDENYLGATEEDLQAVAAAVGTPLTAEHEALLRRGAGYLARTQLVRETNPPLLVELFLGTDERLDDAARVLHALRYSDIYWPRWFVPLAADPFGNYFGVSARATDDGTVWFFNHEQHDDGDLMTGLSVVAPSIHDFLERLQPVS